jgi:hypothetical protein
MSGNNHADRIKELEERLEEANFRADKALDERIACEKKYDKFVFDSTNKYDSMQKTLMEILAGMGLKKGGSRRRGRRSSRKH